MEDKVSLEKLIDFLDRSIVKLKLEFLRNLLIDASKSSKPWKNRKFAKSIGIKWCKKISSSTTIYKWFCGKRNTRVKFLKLIVKKSRYSWKDVENNLIGVKAGTPNGWIKPTFPIKIDKNLGSVIGHILGDGSIDGRYTQPFYSNQNKRLLEEFLISMQKSLGVMPRIWIQEANGFNLKNPWIRRVSSIDEIPDGMQAGLFYPTISGIVLHAIFGKFAIGERKKITPQIKNSNIEFKKSLIRAFFDDEGTVQPEEIGVFQDNKKLLEDIRKMLIELGIVPNKVTSYLKGNKKHYKFTITGYYNFLKFAKTIGFTSAQKQSKLLENITRINKRRSFKLRKNEARNNILLILKGKKRATTKEIRLLLKSKFPDFLWDKSTILRHLHNLENLGLATHRKVGFKYIWEINSV